MSGKVMRYKMNRKNIWFIVAMLAAVFLGGCTLGE